MKKNKIIISGSQGQVGWELARSCSLWGDVLVMDRSEFDLSNLDQIANVIRRERPSYLINAAAYTAVDKAETDQELCRRINADVVGVIAEECKKLNSILIHFSTDYVFDGTKSGAYLETDTPCPINVYGHSKLEGEQNIQSVGGNYFIYRVSWVYSHRGSNFLKTMLKLASQRPELKIVSDQFGAPTWARFIAEAVSLTLADPSLNEKKGIYHLVPHGETNWSDFAQKIFSLAEQRGLQVPQVVPISTQEYPTPARRPKNSRMSNEKLIKTFGWPLQSWEKYLELCVKDSSL